MAVEKYWRVMKANDRSQRYSELSVHRLPMGPFSVLEGN